MTSRSAAPLPAVTTGVADVRRPGEFGLHIWWRVLMRVWTEADRRNLSVVAAGVAFYSLLSIFPALAALIALWGFVADPAMIEDQLGIAAQLLPAEAFAILQGQVKTLVSANASTLHLTTIVSILLAIWTTRNGIGAVVRGLNTIYREEHRANPLMRFGMAILLTVVLVATAILAVASVVVLPSVLALVRLPIPVELAITAVQGLIVLLVVFFGIALRYRCGPNRRGARPPWITPRRGVRRRLLGRRIAGVSIYLRNFGNYNKVHGSLGAVILLLFWFYISAYVVVLGAQIDAELELTTVADTTIGRDRPAGARGAYVADHVVAPGGETRPAGAPAPPQSGSDERTH